MNEYLLKIFLMGCLLEEAKGRERGREVQRIERNGSSNDTISGDELIICLSISFLLGIGVY